MIRQARPDDGPTLCAAEQAWAKAGGILVSRPDELRPEAFSSLIAKLRDGSGCYLVAEQDERLAGHALLAPMDLSAVSHVFRLTIVVHPGFEGRGVGKALMAELLAWAQSSPKVRKVELLVRAENERAIALYKKFGFVEEGRFRDRIRLTDGRYVDDIGMAWFSNR